MSKNKGWRRLEAAAERLESTPNAPPWLKAVVRDSVAVADLLAPREAKDAAPDDFFYPH